jgi:hypothetical protein
MRVSSLATRAAIVRSGLLVLGAALLAVSPLVPWSYSYLPLDGGTPDPTTVHYQIPWATLVEHLDYARYGLSPIVPLIYGVGLLGPPLLLLVLAVWNLMWRRRFRSGLPPALVIIGLLGLLWTWLQWWLYYSIPSPWAFEIASDYGVFIAVAGYLCVLLIST